MRATIAYAVFAACLAAAARGILPCMVNRYGLTNEQIDDILTRHPDAQLRITAQDWRAMRYQLHRFGNMTNYVEQIGGSNDCARVLLDLDGKVTELRSVSNTLARAARTWEGMYDRKLGRYVSATNELRALNVRWTELYSVATNSAAAAERRAARADAAKEWLIEQRDKAILPSTKAIYQAIIDKLEGK